MRCAEFALLLSERRCAAPMMCAFRHAQHCLLPWRLLIFYIAYMSRSTWTWALKLSAVSAIVLTSGCAYVKGWYGSDEAPTKAVVVAATTSTPVLYAPPRHYAADISAARAYVGGQLPVNQRMALLDVRDATEYRLGHPEGARHLPYPRIYQQCQPHPSGAPEAQIRSDDGSVCRFGVMAGSEVVMSAQDFWQALQETLPYKDAPVAVLCRTGACAADVANLMARPDLALGSAYIGKGYKAVYVIKEGFVGEPLMVVDPASGQVLTTDKKGEKFKAEGVKQTLYRASPVALDINKDGKITQEDWGGWRNFLGLPYAVSMPPSLLSDAAQPYYEKP